MKSRWAPVPNRTLTICWIVQKHNENSKSWGLKSIFRPRGMCALHLRSSSPWRQPSRISQVVLFLRRHTTCKSPSCIDVILEDEPATHHGPLTPDTHQNDTDCFLQCKNLPNVYAAVLDCSRVALHVQALTLGEMAVRFQSLAQNTSTHIPQHTRPG